MPRAHTQYQYGNEVCIMTYSKGERKEIGRELNRFSQDGSLEKGPKQAKATVLASLSRERRQEGSEIENIEREGSGNILLIPLLTVAHPFSCSLLPCVKVNAFSPYYPSLYMFRMAVNLIGTSCLHRGGWWLGSRLIRVDLINPERLLGVINNPWIRWGWPWPFGHRNVQGFILGDVNMKQREHAHWLNQIKSIFAIGSALDFPLSETQARANNNITPIRADWHHLYIHTHALTHTIGIFYISYRSNGSYRHFVHHLIV